LYHRNLWLPQRALFTGDDGRYRQRPSHSYFTVELSLHLPASLKGISSPAQRDRVLKSSIGRPSIGIDVLVQAEIGKENARKSCLPGVQCIKRTELSPELC
jgi:hypothetical protein